MNYKCRIESGVELLARLKGTTSLECIYPIIFGNGPNCHDVIELSYELDTQHKSILYEIATKILLPVENFHGRHGGIVVILADGQFDFIELLSVLNSKVKEQLKDELTEDTLEQRVNEVITASLKNLHLVFVYDSHDFTLATCNLENTLAEHPNICLILLDTVSAFYWSECMETTTPIIKMDVYLDNIIKTFKNQIKAYKLVLMYTKPSYFGSSLPMDVPEVCDQNTNVEEKLDQINIKICLTYQSSDSGPIIEAKVVTKNSTFLRNYILVNNEIKWI